MMGWRLGVESQCTTMKFLKKHTDHPLTIMQNASVHIANMKLITQNSVECVGRFPSKHYSYTCAVF